MGQTHRQPQNTGADATATADAARFLRTLAGHIAEAGKYVE